MCNSRPNIRVGQTLDFDGSIHGVEGSGEVKSLRSKEAEEIAFRIFLNIDNIVDSMCEEISKIDGLNARENNCMRGKNRRLSRDSGLVIDSSTVFIETNCFHHRIRICLTVCQPGSRSKLWFRSQCASYLEQGEVRAPVEMSNQQIEQFYIEATQLATPVLAILRDHYSEVIATLLSEPENTKASAELNVGDEYQFRSFDTDRIDLLELYSDLEGNGASFTEEVEKKTLSGSSHPTLLAVHLAVGDSSSDQDAINEIKNSSRYEVLGYRNKKQETGIFIRSEQKREGHDTGELIIFNGVAYDEEAAERQKNLGESPGYRLSAEMLAGAVRSRP